MTKLKVASKLPTELTNTKPHGHLKLNGLLHKAMGPFTKIRVPSSLRKEHTNAKPHGHSKHDDTLHEATGPFAKLRVPSKLRTEHQEYQTPWTFQRITVFFTNIWAPSQR